MQHISLRGVREHNLHNLDLDLPRGTWIALTGPSGSGKSSLAMGVLMREGQRRYLGGLSAHARQFLDKAGRAQVLSVEGLPPTVAITASGHRGGPRSTVGTRTGIDDLLRQWFSRAGVGPAGVVLSRAHFGYRAPHACDSCLGLGVVDRVATELLVADASKSIRGGALLPTLKNGYTVYSQVTVDVLDSVCRAHGFDVDTPWCELSDAHRHVIFYGSRALKVPFGKHSLQSRMRWSGITARARSEGYYRGLIPVIEETLKRDRNPNILRYVATEPCGTCGGSRLGAEARATRVGGLSYEQVQHTPVGELRQLAWPASQVLSALLPSITPRLAALQDLGLGHLCLARSLKTLSDGEVQRVRLSALVSAPLSGVLYVLDEPTLGLHPVEQRALAMVLRGVVDRGNTLIAVEHDPDMVRHADVVLALGPGAGPDGGRVVSMGAVGPQTLAVPHVGGEVAALDAGEVVVTGARAHNLRKVRCAWHREALNVVVGPSGAGKSTLVLHTLVPSLRAGRPVDCDGVQGGDDLDVRWLDAAPLGRTPRSTPATYTGLLDLLRKRLAKTEVARALGQKASSFSHNTKAGRCATCEGLGVVKVGLHLLEDAVQTCSACGGGRYDASVLKATLHGLDVASLLRLTVGDAARVFSDDPPCHAILDAMLRLGLSYLRLGQSCTTLSGGEAQRVRLATVLATCKRPALLVLDEPERGLHPTDVQRLVHTLRRTVQAGHTVLCIAHSRQVIRAADRVTELVDGEVVFEGTPSELQRQHTPTGVAMRGLPPAEHQAAVRPDAIELSGVTTHNLRDVNVRIPHGELVVLAGVSGSGKSSLAFDTLAAESWSRFAESLPGQVRRLIHALPRPTMQSATGLTPVVALRQRQARGGGRSTVATLGQIGPSARLLWSRYGDVAGLSAAHFRTDGALGACEACQGEGTVSRCDPARLIRHPDRALHDGAMQSSRPGRHFGEPDGRYMATLHAAAQVAGVDVMRPWEQLSSEAQRLALFGTGGTMYSVTWAFKRGARTGEHSFEGPWHGLCSLVEAEAEKRKKSKRAAEYRQPLVEAACPNCVGSGLLAPARDAKVQGLTLAQWLALPCEEALSWLLAQDAVHEGLLHAMEPTLRTMVQLRLGHLSLDRRVHTLSGGEVQRLRLARQLHLGLSGVTYVLDEPTAGLHALDVQRLMQHLRALQRQGNTVVIVEHRPAVLRAADRIIEIGPGAGDAGGRVVADGPADQVLASDSPTAVALRRPPLIRAVRDRPVGLRVLGAHLHTLKGFDLDLPVDGFVTVEGPSGSGKSSLLRGVIEASANAGLAVGCEAIHGLSAYNEVVVAGDASVGPMSTALTLFGALPALKKLFSASAKRAGLSAAALSYQSASGACASCKGAGHQRITMDFVADLRPVCAVCQGWRYKPEVLALEADGLTLRGLLSSTLCDLPATTLGPWRRAAVALGLGHLQPLRAAHTLSGGEVQRLMLASRLARAVGKERALVLLDEPGRGLHASDIVDLVRVLHTLADQGDLVIAVAHRNALLRSADRRVALGPVGGPLGGHLVQSST